MKCAEVLIDHSPLGVLDYAIPDAMQVDVGTRVKVPVRNTTRDGTVVKLKSESAFNKLADILAVTFEMPPKLYELASFISKYYHTPLVRVLKTMLPKDIRSDKAPKTQKWIERAQTRDALSKFIPKVSEPQRRVLEVLLKNQGGIFLSALLEQAEVSMSPVKTLIKNGLIKEKEITVDRSEMLLEDYFQTKHKKLTDEQQKTLDAILKDDQFGSHLIFGITGSGKTEIYLQAIQEMLDQGKGVIMLVPEISLTTQTIERFRARFSEKMGVLHHRLSDGERLDMWRAIYRGDIQIVIGARSAIFSPVKNLGLILVDEEHDHSYKQTDEMPCYNARDIAVMRAKLENAKVVLGSATPSLESYKNALDGKYELHHLRARADSANMPTVHLVKPLQGLFSDELIEGLKLRLENGEQSLVFLNRRGYHACQMCTKCEHTVDCPHCDMALTFHKKDAELICHLCGYRTMPPRNCPHCKSPANLKFKGVGTELVENTLKAILPEARTLRMDADTTRHKGSHDRLFKQFRSGKADILIGTQMVAKGLHFPNVTLVGVLNADSALNIPDPRASEQVFQLITQVSGRSGRGALAGEVIIQTRLKDHYVIQKASKSDFEGFFEEEAKVRKLLKYPPYAPFVKLIFSGDNEAHTQQEAERMRAYLLKTLPASSELFPVQPCGHAKVKDRYRFKLILRGRLLAALPPSPKEIKRLIDIDPLSLLS
ncbi:MAG: Primosomal protein N' [Chlamydiia bacterium]|nr:Primosomal protein N' [Chlamydiia bacterium]MCH9615209.1 Primosomal protein N' [Chlamydiia bacterium]MCH9628469.1 Primosomal protein N' [Chlamydiia bacterium]